MANIHASSLSGATDLVSAGKDPRLNVLRERERDGSRPRCVLFTDGPDQTIAARLTALIEPFGFVDPHRHKWAPRGFVNTAEVRLDLAEDILPLDVRRRLASWWLVETRGANTPNWDIVSTATIGGNEGLILVEAKAHAAEMTADGKPLDRRASEGSLANHARIGAAIREASAALSVFGQDWGLCADVSYQLCNRFAWSWKLAALGYPVILIYLGFLNADEMSRRGPPLRSHDSWNNLVRAHGAGLVPDTAWGDLINVGAGSVRALIRSVEVPLAMVGG